jgi:DNA-binding NarL/FixJ family response regulator|tara:strand:+ start:2829 stop:3218 length:390 start_codon:yes stop_codon:yes gene_type:complete
MIRILIAEDCPYVLDGLTCLIQAQSDFDLVGTAKDGQEALERALELRPDVVIMDAQMPRLDGVEATRLLKRTSPDVGVLFFSVFTEYLEASVVAGSDGCLCKDCEPTALFAEIRRIASRPPTEDLAAAD